MYTNKHFIYLVSKGGGGSVGEFHPMWSKFVTPLWYLPFNLCGIKPTSNNPLRYNFLSIVCSAL